MAVNRLIVVLIVVMLMSTLAAALAPVRPEEGSEETTTTTTSEDAAAEQGGRDRHATLRAPNQGPHPIGGAVGDALTLDVFVGAPGYVSIPDIGRLEFATPEDPAEFFIYLRRAGRYEVRFGERDRLIATIVVVERATG